ncbi:MAG: gliding motility-associated-like protein [Paraglaciecola sp.]|jgi:gliding motility-associated-like protein
MFHLFTAKSLKFNSLSMKKLLTFSLFLYSVALIAQPAYDDCQSVFQLGEAPNCPIDTIFNNVNATESDIGFDNFPPCFNGGAPVRDIWISFVASDTIFDYAIELTACPDLALGLAPILQPQIAVYRGDCGFDELQLLDCATTEVGEANLLLELDGLTPGLEYFIRINDWSATGTPNMGAFKLCVKERDPIVIIDGDITSTACTGELFDSGGPDGDYGNDENFTFTVCPSDLHNCILFSMEYYNIEDAGDQLTIFDGDGTNGPVLLTTNGGNFPNTGSVCYQVAASSGCLTLQFQSDGSSTFEGFHAFWECTTEDCDLPTPLTVDTDIEDIDILNNISTPQTTVTIASINCPDGAYGTFQADDSDLGLEKGLILTSGGAAGAVGPSNNFASTVNGVDGDIDLDALSPDNPSQDACIIELDIFVATDELTFEYVFGSEEYPVFAQPTATTFNDIFAFLVSGPGITGDPLLNGQENIAVLPDGNNTLVEIASVNEGVNWEYYRNNETVAGTQNGLSVAYGGLTSDYLGIKKSLTARTDVIPCNTYRLKLAIADRGDSSFDSGVFISELKGGSPSIGVQYFSGIDYLVEDCTAIPDNITINIGTEQDDDTTFDIVIGGTATIGVDYTLDIPSTITIPAGQTEVTFPIIPISDDITEGTETIEIQLTNNFGCGTVIFSTLTIDLEDALEVDIFAGQDTVFVCQDGCTTLSVQGAQSYLWSPPGAGFDTPIGDSPELCPTQSQFINVLGTLGVCTDRDTIWVQLIDPEVEIMPLGATDFCQGDSVVLQATNNVGDAGLQWTPAMAIEPDPNTQTVTVNPQDNTIYIATVQLAGCMASDTFQVNVDEFDFPELLVLDTFICQTYPVTLAAPINNTTTTYQWTSNPNDPDQIDCDTCANPTVTPQVPTTYTVLATSENGYCDETAEITIDVAPAILDIADSDTIEICLGELVNLSAVTNTGGLGLLWFPSDSLSSTTEADIVANPTQTITYFATLDVGDCSVIDSVVIVVDSLPNLNVIAIPDMESYCEGDEITFVSQTYEPFDYPNIDFNWMPLTGQQTPDSNLNLVILAPPGETVYVRETTNRGCSSLDSITIIAVPTMNISIDPATSQICSDGEVQLQVNTDTPVEPEDITWSGDGLSCGDCLDPIASPTATTTYTVELDFDGCPVNASATVEIIDPFFGQPNPQICFGDNVVLNTAVDPNATYLWNGGTLVNDPAAAPTVSPTENTTYTVVIDNGSCTLEQTVTIVVVPAYTFTVSGGTQLCSGTTITISGDAINSNGSIVSGNYVWTLNGNVIQGATTANIDVMPPLGNNTYEVTFTDGAGCQMNSGTIMVEVLESPTFQAPTITEICPGDEIILNQVDDGISSYTWTLADGTALSSDAQPPVSPTTTTTYNLFATNTICDISESVTITVFGNYNLNVEPTDSTLCSDDAANFTLTAAAVFPDGTSVNGTYSWTQAGNEFATTAIVDVTAPADAMTVYEVSFTDELGCNTENNEVTLTLNGSPAVDTLNVLLDGVVVDTVFEGQSLTLSALSELTFGTFTFFNNNGEVITDEDAVIYNVGNPETNPIIAPSIEGNDPTVTSTATYNATYVDENGCDVSFSTTIVILNNPVEVPNAFTPNGDTNNDVFTVTGLNITLVDFRIYNRWGQEVYTVKGGVSETDGWNGGKDNDLDKPAPADVYIYHITYQVNQNDPMTESGDVTLIR